jgi:hypothetical protein
MVSSNSTRVQRGLSTSATRCSPELLQQQAAQRRLAGATSPVSWTKPAAAALADAEQQVRERIPMALAENTKRGSG